MMDCVDNGVKTVEDSMFLTIILSSSARRVSKDTSKTSHRALTQCQVIVMSQHKTTVLRMRMASPLVLLRA